MPTDHEIKAALNRSLDAEDTEKTPDKMLFDHLTEDQRLSTEEDFDRLDVNMSGTLTMDEYYAGEARFHHQLYGMQPTDDELREFYRLKDRLKDHEMGFREFSEARALLILHHNGTLVYVLTEDEKARAKDVFDSLDRTGDGMVCETEAKAFFEKRSQRDVANGKRNPEQAVTDVMHRLDTLFRNWDTDQNKQVTFDEFLAHEAKTIIACRDVYNGHALTNEVTSYMNHYSETGMAIGHECVSILTPDQIEHAQMKFSDWDKDGSGTLTLAELRHVSKEVGLHIPAPKFKKVIKAAFKQFDTDQNGSLTFTEFLHIYNFLYLKQLNLDECI